MNRKHRGKNSNLWVQRSCDIRIRFITTFQTVSHSFFPKNCSSRPFSLSKWESEKKERSWADVMLHSLRAEWYSISCTLCFSLQAICPNNKKKYFDKPSFGEKHTINNRLKPKKLPVYTAEMIRDRPMLNLRKFLSYFWNPTLTPYTEKYPKMCWCLAIILGAICTITRGQFTVSH